MAFSINDIKGALKYGGARPTQFKVQIFNPIDNSADAIVPFLVKAASLPGSFLGTIPVYYFGRAVKFGGDRDFQPWDVTVINDEDFKIRNALEIWSNKINALERNIRDLPTSEANLYKSEAIVYQYGKTGEVLREITFRGIWPSNISPIGTSWEAQNQIEEFGVTFEYDSYEITGGSTGLGGGA